MPIIGVLRASGEQCIVLLHFCYTITPILSILKQPRCNVTESLFTYISLGLGAGAQCGDYDSGLESHIL